MPQPFVARKGGEHLRLELRPGFAGDDRHSNDAEQRVDRADVSASRDVLLLASVPSRSKTISRAMQNENSP